MLKTAKIYYEKGIKFMEKALNHLNKALDLEKERTTDTDTKVTGKKKTKKHKKS